MPETHGLAPQVIRAFKENPVWDEIWKRMNPQIEAAMDAAIDSSDPKAAGKYRALVTMKNLPDQLLKEIDEESSVLKVVKKAVGRRSWL